MMNVVTQTEQCVVLCVVVVYFVCRLCVSSSVLVYSHYVLINSFHSNERSDFGYSPHLSIPYNEYDHRCPVHGTDLT